MDKVMDDFNITDIGNECDKFDDESYKILSAVRAFLGLFSLICCLLVIIVIILFKRYQYFVQRLVLYVCIAAAINSVAIIAQKVDYFTPSEQQSDILDKYCIFAGCFEFFTSIVQLISLVGITHGLYHSVIKERPKKFFEAVYISLSLLVPSILCCIPFFGISYGKSGPWCWIRERDSNCQPFYLGIVLQFSLWYTPLILVTIVVMCVSVATLYRVHKSYDSQWQGPYDPEVYVHRGRLKKVVKIMLAYLPILYLVVNLFSLPNAIYWSIGDSPILALWVFHAIFPPLRGALIALPYLFHNETRRQISKINIAAAIKRRFKRKVVTTYPVKQCAFSDSLQFPSLGGDTTIERQKHYRNPSLSYNTPTPPVVPSPLHSSRKPPQPPMVVEGVVTLQLDGDSSTLSSVNVGSAMSQSTYISDVGENNV